jgi:hypothetical protein
MTKPAVVLLVTLLSACGGGGSNTNKKIVVPADSSTQPDAGTDVCNPLTQSGCAAGQKCTWVTDATMPTMLGHIDCVPDGVAATGAACTMGMPGPTGYDDCAKGNYCEGSVCKLICDPQGGSPMCPSSFSCVTYSGVFGSADQAAAAGVCNASCDPLADNKFGSSKTKTGTTCSESQGCYGRPSNSSPSRYICADEVNPTLYHRAACTTASGCASPGGVPYVNGCAQGFIALLYDSTGSMQVDCESLCKPASCYAGNCGASSLNLPGVAPHRCNTSDSSGLFNTASASNNGDQCVYTWRLEVDSAGSLVRSPTSDTLGICVDHSRYKYDSNGDGMIGTGDLAWPKCDTFTTAGSGTGSASGSPATCTAANGCVGAADFGCVDTATGGVSFQGKPARPAVHIDLPRLPYSQVFAPR